MMHFKTRKTSKRNFYLLKKNTPVMEAYRVLRTNLEFSGTAKKLQTVLLTSSVAQEGKSTVACNLAKAFAYAGKKTLIIDFDLRCPVLHNFFRLDNTLGITDHLLDKITLEEAIKPTDVENLYLLNSGTLPPNPAEILASKKIVEIIDSLRESFDLIIIDTPPVAVLSDAAIASRFADAVLVVTTVEKTRTDDLNIAIENLHSAGADIRGIILNRVTKRTRGYKHYSYYSKYY